MAPRAVAEPVDESDALREVLSLLRVRTGHDFVNYKSATLLRRIQRRMNVAGVSTLGPTPAWCASSPRKR